MLTTKQKEILKKGKAGREIAEKERHKFNSYYYKVRFEARKKVKNAFYDMGWLTEKYPEAIDPKDLIELTECYLQKGMLTKEDLTFQLPPRSIRKRFGISDLEVRKRSPWIQIAGCPRDTEGAPLKKPLHWERIQFVFELLNVIHKQFVNIPANTPLVTHVRDVVTIASDARTSISMLESWLADEAKTLMDKNVKIIVLLNSH